MFRGCTSSLLDKWLYWRQVNDDFYLGEVGLLKGRRLFGYVIFYIKSQFFLHMCFVAATYFNFFLCVVVYIFLININCVLSLELFNHNNDNDI